MNLIRFQPFQELTSLRQAMDRLFEDGPGRPFRLAPAFDEGLAPAVDVYETTDELLVKAPLPGVKPEDIEVAIEDGLLTIKGETKTGSEGRKGNYLVREHRTGKFFRRLQLPDTVDTEKVESRYEHGVLSITLPKLETKKAKRLDIKVAA